MTESKICSTCGTLKSINDFHRDISKKDGYRNNCKKCSIFNRDYHQQLETILEKTCNKCRQIKPLEKFIKDKRTPLGYGMICLDCSQTKQCRKCWQSKNVQEFYHSNRSGDGFAYRCKECVHEDKREAYKKDSSVTLHRQSFDRFKKGTREGTRERMLLKNYGMTLEDYEKLLSEQDNCCKICGAKEGELGRQYLAIDHNHETNEVRGLLCDLCNRGLGFFRDDKTIISKALQYLSDFG